MKTSLSNEQKENFIGWINNWDSNILTIDDQDSKIVLREKINNAIDKLNLLMSESDNKALQKFPNDEKKAVENMFENQNKQWYKDFQKICNDLHYVANQFEYLYEMKFRRTHEIFKLRAENAKLRK